VGAISVSGNRDQEWFFATLSGFTNPGLVGRYTFGGKKEEKKEEREGWKLWRETVVKGLRPDEFRAEQVCRP
jgi:prolyl oligopeptidase